MWGRKAAFSLVAQLHQKCDSGSLGFLRGWFVPIWQGNLVPCPGSPKPSQSKALLETVRKEPQLGTASEPNPTQIILWGLGRVLLASANWSRI